MTKKLHEVTSTNPSGNQKDDGYDVPYPMVYDKRAFAQRWHFSTRTVDSFLSQGMPHLKIGSRRVRILVADADRWMKEKFGIRRLGS